MTTSLATLQFWPKMQLLPILAPFWMWQKCQILVPSPISQGSSTYADRA